MSICDTCKNEYENSFEIIQQGNRYVFDCFECAIQKLAPQCKQCSCKIIGHGIQANSEYFCGANCARMSGVDQATDNVDTK